MDIKNFNEILLSVQKPARYTGGEWNSVRKEWIGDKVKVCLAFPEIYEIGMSYLGMKVLYGILNERADSLCERVFSPWHDFEKALRDNKIPLFSLESRRPIKDFDIVGIHLTYELTYTNALNILDLGGIPVRSSERKDDDPIIIAGGPACFNPEPMAEFIDAFVIGDGEDVIGEIVEAYKTAPYRRNILEALAKIEGVYVPSLYDKPKHGRIKKRIVMDLDNAFYPTRQVVPYIQIVHDRIALEIMRGCKHVCRFCQAGTTYLPRRERSKEKILELAKKACEETGFDEVSLLSLSSGDHSRIREIIEGLNGAFEDRALSVSVPSLRIEDILNKLPLLISKVKKPGLTFAPEAGSDCLRKAINKNIDIEKLFQASLESFKAGWNRVKLYFMIGLPGETDDDILKIAELLYKVSDLKRGLDGRPAHVTASINPFVPKPHTPFERNPMEGIDALNAKRGLLTKSVRSRMIELDFHSFQMSCLEALFTRGDRRLSVVVYEAWRSGARFDGWQDHFDYSLWQGAIQKAGVAPDCYINRQIAPDEPLPWDIIDISVNNPLR